jgi:hypothetical protein
MDPLAAARRLANYWKIRKEIFQERAFLPTVDLSGHGALTADDVRILQTGYCIHLPRDEQGRSVLYADNSKKRSDVTPSQRTKFFIFQCMMENQKTHTDGFVMLFNISNPFAANYEPNNGKVIRFLLDQCMPVKSIRVHVIHIPVPGTDITPSFIDTGKCQQCLCVVFFVVHCRKTVPDNLFRYSRRSKKKSVYSFSFEMSPYGTVAGRS